jgi:hypothetical protein
MQLELKITEPQPILLDTVMITANTVTVVSSGCSTSFCNERRIPFISVDDLINKYKSTIKLAKSKGIKVSYQKKPLSTLKRIKGLSGKLPAEFDEYNAVFDKLVTAWGEKVEKGIYTGYCDDNELKSISTIAHKLSRYTHRNTAMGQAIDILSSLNDACYFIQNSNPESEAWIRI